AQVGVVGAEVTEALGLGAIGVERHDRDALLDGGVDGSGELLTVAARDSNTLANAGERLDVAGLLSAVLLMGRSPLERALDAFLGAQFLAGLGGGCASDL